jgi:Leucine-rich repeat (LRR) protein
MESIKTPEVNKTVEEVLKISNKTHNYIANSNITDLLKENAEKEIKNMNQEQLNNFEINFDIKAIFEFKKIQELEKINNNLRKINENLGVIVEVKTS